MNDRILLGHGGGGRLTQQLIQEEILSRFGAGPLQTLPDAASLILKDGRIRFSTDSFVVHPLEFPGGNIGDLAVHGTVNDLAVSGSHPRWLSLGMILEEGLPLATLRRVLDAIQRAAHACGVIIATGDTKVVRRGQCDGLYLNTAGIGEAIPELSLGLDRINVGDRILVSGTLGDHGMAVLSVREGLRIQNGPVSDTRSVQRLVTAIAPLADAIRFMRDPTRGGLATTLNDMVLGQPFGMFIREKSLPLAPESIALAEMLGLDLLHVASEGCLALACAREVADSVLATWRSLPEGAGAREIGWVTDQAGRVILETAIGGQRIIDVPSGELLPRIC
ncbi:MAG: hydrogenase expression/formation protein HypE [Magnetococcales bacterium]|nr:hydrogenase expression/formation protein HypE [Magnetococcales bacterium]MBF0151383.1 hydrogenase expression/formation protein HypE [Magnetococcales bacterium]MBF0174349.1 hydrogenase expression/formation protein HypE [Magnetococcales bacterium]MBF0348320.1 hydrogenase expression/formation protein HypE [Magnetococcales bacterium]MBF0631559.1 hydrogenase expression/formation protein HypE [Magnetococcales bacterium]